MPILQIALHDPVHDVRRGLATATGHIAVADSRRVGALEVDAVGEAVDADESHLIPAVSSWERAMPSLTVIGRDVRFLTWEMVKICRVSLERPVYLGGPSERAGIDRKAPPARPRRSAG